MAAGGRMDGRSWALLVVLSILWGGSFFFAKVALAELPPLTLVWLRVAGAAVALLVVVRISGAAMPASVRGWAPFAAMGLLNNVVPFALISWSQTAIDSGLAAILNATTPLFAIVLAHLLTRDERLTSARLAGVLCGVAGVAVMIGRDALAGIGTHVVAQLAVLAATLCYGLAGIFGRRFRGQSPVVTAAGQVTASAAMLLPIALAVDQPWTLAPPGWATIGAVAGTALLSTALGYVIYFRILAVAGATNLLLVTLLIPVSALLLGGLVLGEAITASKLAGMALIFAGLAVIDGRAVAMLRGRGAVSQHL
jgi:drug/metabolite transporter (DMT)-like permease